MAIGLSSDSSHKVPKMFRYVCPRPHPHAAIRMQTQGVQAASYVLARTFLLQIYQQRTITPCTQRSPRSRPETCCSTSGRLSPFRSIYTLAPAAAKQVSFATEHLAVFGKPHLDLPRLSISESGEHLPRPIALNNPTIRQPSIARVHHHPWQR